MPQLKSISFTGALVLASIQAACLDEPAPEDIGASTEPAAAGSGSGSDSTCDPPPPSPCVAGCGKSCAPVPAPAQGRYPATKKSGWGTVTHTYRLRATKYKVTWAGGWHTGIGFTHSQKTQGESLRCEDTNGDGVGDATRISPYATAPTPEEWLPVRVHNHGRTVLTDDLGHSTVNTTVEYTTGGKQPAAYDLAMQACIGIAGTDGFCDRMCGNDAYTVPDGVKNDNDDPHPGDPAPFSNRRRYGAMTTSDPTRWSHMTDFTALGWPHYRVPRYGHNSNNDANANNAMMGQCNGFRGWLDSAYDVMVSPSAQCGVDWATIGSQLDSRIATVCATNCAGVRMSNYPVVPTGDRCIAAGDSGLAGFDGTNVQPQPASSKWMPAGNYLQGDWGYTVGGM